MDRQEIVKLFLKNGLQLDLDSLNLFFEKQDYIQQFLTKIKNLKVKPSIITSDFALSILKRPEIIVLKEPKVMKKTLKVEDYMRYFTERYNRISSILSKRLDLVNLISISKLTRKSKRFSIIGAVKEKNKNSLTIEDLTGELSLTYDDKNSAFTELVLDEIVGIMCERNDTVEAKTILWPDIPLKREINKTKEDTYCLFISSLHMDDKNFNREYYDKFLDWSKKIDYEKFFVFVLGDISSDEKDIIKFFDDLPKSFKVFTRGTIDPDIKIGDLTLKDPSLVKIDNVVLLISYGGFIEKYKQFWPDLPQHKIMELLLKKRHINPVFNLNEQVYEEDPFILDTIPDIFVSGSSREPTISNYKGTTIITTGSFIFKPIYYLTNLRTRETIKIDFT